MIDLYIELGEGRYAVISGVGKMDIVSLSKEVCGTPSTWKLTPRAVEWCEAHGIPLFGFRVHGIEVYS